MSLLVDEEKRQRRVHELDFGAANSMPMSGARSNTDGTERKASVFTDGVALRDVGTSDGENFFELESFGEPDPPIC